MTDEEIRDALNEARGAFAPFSVADHALVLRERVVGDLDAIDEWVRARGGCIHTEPGYESQQFGGSPWERSRTSPSHWYVVPASALRG